jgi:hypothetical protein
VKFAGCLLGFTEHSQGAFKTQSTVLGLKPGGTREACSIGRHCNPKNGIDVLDKRSLQLEGFGIPDPDGTITPTGDHGLAILRNGQVMHRAVMPPTGLTNDKGFPIASGWTYLIKWGRQVSQ